MTNIARSNSVQYGMRCTQYRSYVKVRKSVPVGGPGDFVFGRWRRLSMEDKIAVRAAIDSINKEISSDQNDMRFILETDWFGRSYITESIRRYVWPGMDNWTSFSDIYPTRRWLIEQALKNISIG